MRPTSFLLALGSFLLIACTATPDRIATPDSIGTPRGTDSRDLSQHGDVLRIAIFGEVTTTNVWALFDRPGASYWNYATQVGYWPRLYHLAPPSFDFEPATAKAATSPVECSGGTCTATVILQPNLTWTDGSPFTAEDVAFTINSALNFRLGLNWNTAYNPDVLDHAEPINDTAVRFYFVKKPNLSDWQYGALQGPIVNQAYWQPRIAAAARLLPDESLFPDIQGLERELIDFQTQIDGLYLLLNTMAPASTAYQDTSKQAKDLQDELNSITNKLDKKRSEFETKLADARASLYSLANANEPTLGTWRFASRIPGDFLNQANPGTSFGDPRFDKVRYITFGGQSMAIKALLDNEVDIILSPTGLSRESISQLQADPAISLGRNMTRSARFLAFNHSRPFLGDPALHQAMACIINQQVLVEFLDGDAAALPGFVVDEYWKNAEASLPCANGSAEFRLTEAVNLLKSAGYSWRKEPKLAETGAGFKDPEGNLIPHFELLIPEQDVLRTNAAEYIVQQAQSLGLTIETHVTDPDGMLYAVYSSRDYDMALLGWHLSAYPAYLCEWFMTSGQNPFAYVGSRPKLSQSAKLVSTCEAWNKTNDLDEAQEYVHEIQSILAKDLPIIPLYVENRTDAYRNIRYPFENVLDGLAILYAAPSMAIPIQ
ncbi:MAG: ABC transporter substrate-binding protein [Anaerolineae bacterium]|nr:ABC transporter substrate-binding protein [Anaerolineae bacterium]